MNRPFVKNAKIKKWWMRWRKNTREKEIIRGRSILSALFLCFRAIFVTFWQKLEPEHILLRTFFLSIFWQLGVHLSIFYKISHSIDILRWFLTFFIWRVPTLFFCYLKSANCAFFFFFFFALFCNFYIYFLPREFY